jgi:putative glutamine transport system substrate-binding protein
MLPHLRCLCFALLALLWAPLSHAERLTVLYAPSSGWAEATEQGPVGASIELMDWFASWLADSHGIMVELHYQIEPDWRTFYRTVRDSSGAVFGLGNVTITAQRQTELAFSPGYAHNVALMILPDETDVQALDQLRGAAFAGTLHAQRMSALTEQWPTLQIDAVHSNDELLRRVSDGGHFAIIDGYNAIQAQARGLPIQTHPDYAEGDEQFGIIMPLDNPWQTHLAEFFAAKTLPDNARWRAILTDHLGTEIAELMTRP